MYRWTHSGASFFNFSSIMLCQKKNLILPNYWFRFLWWIVLWGKNQDSHSKSLKSEIPKWLWGILIGSPTICASLSPLLIGFLVFPPMAIISNQPSAMSSLCATISPFPPSLRHVPTFPLLIMSRCNIPSTKHNVSQSTISCTLSLLTTCMSLNIYEDVCACVCQCVCLKKGKGPPVKGIIGRDRWPPLPPSHTHIYTQTHICFKHSLSVWSWLLLPVPVLALFCRSEQQERATSVPRWLVMSVQK